MKKKFLKTVVVSLLFFILTFICVFVTAEPLSECVTLLKQSFTMSSFCETEYLTFSDDNLSESYSIAKNILSEDENFDDLIYAEKMSVSALSYSQDIPELKYSYDEYNNYYNVTLNNYIASESYLFSSVYSKRMIDSGYATLTQGRLINTDKTDESKSGLEVLVGDSSKFNLGDKICVILPFFDSDDKQISVNATVVGKIKLNKYIYTMGQRGIHTFFMTKSNNKLPTDDVILIENFFDENMPDNYYTQLTHYSDAPAKFVILHKNSSAIQSEILESAAKNSSALLGEWYEWQNLCIEEASVEQSQNILLIISVLYLMYIITVFHFVKTIVRIWKRKD